MNRRWTKEEIWQWYNSQTWIRGFNGIPANCVSFSTMWQKYDHEATFAQIRKEFELAKSIGFNAVRTVAEFEVWLAEHDSFMEYMDEYMALADEYGMKVMLVVGNDCNPPKQYYKAFAPGKHEPCWGWHGGTDGGTFNEEFVTTGWQPLDDENMRPLYFKMVDELAAKYAKDERLHIWDVWNEIGNSRRGTKSVPYLEELFRIIRSHDPIQPLTADCWTFNADTMAVETEEELRALELSDLITFHYYRSFQNMVRIIDWLKETYDRPIINNEWLNRIEHNNVDEIYPLFYLQNIGSYHWGLVQGFSQTYEPWGEYLRFVRDPDYNGPLDLTKWQHDLYRFNGMPYIAKEIEIIKKFNQLADERFAKNSK